MPSNADAEDQIAFIAANTRLPTGRLVIDEILGAVNCIRAARKAKWPPHMIKMFEDKLISSLAEFHRQYQRIENI